jgi:hypothetical protein
MRRWNVVMLAAVLGICTALPAVAQWKWRDKSGQTQYSDLPPPPGVSDQDILQRPTATTRRVAPEAASAPSLAPSGAARPSEPELEAKRKKAEEDAIAEKKKAEDAKNAASKAENCNRARAQMRTIDSGQRVARVNEKGEREFLDDAARADEAKRTRDIMAANCN